MGSVELGIILLVIGNGCGYQCSNEIVRIIFLIHTQTHHGDAQCNGTFALQEGVGNTQVLGVLIFNGDCPAIVQSLHYHLKTVVIYLVIEVHFRTFIILVGLVGTQYGVQHQLHISGVLLTAPAQSVYLILTFAVGQLLHCT